MKHKETDEIYVQTEDAICLECGDRIADTAGRIDRKFCCESCRNKYHYRGNRTRRNIKARTDTILQHNHDILDGLLALNRTSIERTEALQIGFDPNYMTTCQVGRGQIDCSCYDISYRITAGKISKISKCLTTLAPSKSKKA